MGREVSVSNLTPGSIKYLSVAVAIDQAALAKASAADINKVKELVTAAVGARADRGDQVTVIMRPFEKIEEEAIPFYETGWFAMAVRNGVAILAVLLVLLLAVRPAIKALKARTEPSENEGEDEETVLVKGPDGTYSPAPNPGVDREALDAQIALAQRIARENPDDAVRALRLLLSDNSHQGQAA